MYVMYLSDEQRSDARKEPRPYGLRPQRRPAALRVLTLESPRRAPRALPATFWGGNAATVVSIDRS